MEGDRLATARSGIQRAGKKAHGKVAALANPAALHIERDGNLRDAGADLRLAEFYGDAEERVASLGGELLGVALLFWRHARVGVSKAERPVGKGFRPGVCGLGVRELGDVDDGHRAAGDAFGCTEHELERGVDLAV